MVEEKITKDVHKAQLDSMAKKVEKKETKEAPKVAETNKEWVRESWEDRMVREEKEKLAAWVPKTELGKLVRAGKIKNIEEILESGQKIMESQIVDLLLNLEVELLNIGQAKGKFGGGKRRPWKQTQKKTKEGNVATFSVLAVVGDGNGYLGMGSGRASETLPAKEKAIRKAKLNIQRIKRACSSFDCSCSELHSVPMKTEGKCSGVKIILMPAPQGTGLVIGDELKKILKLAGIKDIYSKTFGPTRTTINAAKACLDALTKLENLKL